jgi:autotransporter-associated beta strand protein
MQSNHSRRAAVALAAAALAVPSLALAQNGTWKNTGTDYSLGENWDSGVVPTGIATFPNVTPTNQPNVTGLMQTVGQLDIQGGGWVFSGNRLALNTSGGGIASTGGPTGTLTFDNPVGIGANQPWNSTLAIVVNGLLDGAGGTSATRQLTVSGTGGVTFNGGIAIHGAASTVTNRAMSFEGTGNIVVNSVISDGLTATGIGSVRVRSSGTVSLLGANTYRGGTQLGGLNTTVGTVIFNSDASFGDAAGPIRVNDNSPGVILQLASGSGAVTINAGRTWTLGSGTGTRTVTLSLPNAADSLTIAGNISETAAGFGSLTKTGPGTLVLGGTNTYTNDTTVSGGTLLVNGSTAAGDVFSVATGARLGGGGSIGSAVTVSGAVAPGQPAGAGTLTVNGAVTMDATASLEIDVASATSFDKLVIGNAGVLTAAGKLVPTVAAGYVPAPAAAFEVATFGSVTGTFENSFGYARTADGKAGFEMDVSTGTSLVLRNYQLIGDVDVSGAVNNQDIAPFVALLTGGSPTGAIGFAADVDGNGVVNNQDIAPFVALLTGGRPLADLGNDPEFAPLIALVPEPATLSLVAAAGLLALRRRRVG